MFGGKLDKDQAGMWCRRLFLAGFLLLPWMWFANAALFWKWRSKTPTLRKYIWASVAAFIASFFVLAAWLVFLYTYGKDFSIWVIYPGKDYRQNGIWSSRLPVF
eukprot:TRINITY_DN47148_c0_g1_i1.p1 TRINITY_DN47148_c0_g1~~TRINITY_DN47148_c0_g1_i1.p1  ORF type:complete len:104 (-),score=5.68 TRINITY_DN47148_c0_g1_i1:441-752(-)